MNLTVALQTGQLTQAVPGGIGRYTTELRNRLPGFGVDVVPFGPHRQHALVYERWHRMRWPSARIGRAVDVVHAPSLAVPPAGKRPLVVTVHDMVFEYQPELLTPRGVAFHRRGLALARAKAAAVIVPSNYVARLLVDAGFPTGLVHVIHHGIDQPAERAADGVTRALERLGVQPPYVLAVGTVEPRKGLDVLAAAMETIGDVGLVLAGGTGWGTVPGLDHALRLGTVADDDLDALYRGALALAVPTRGEGFGMPVLEAMVRGCPVVASNVASIPEVAGDAALLVPPGNVDALRAALRTLADNDLRRDLATRGRDRARTFTWDACLTAHRAVYEGARAARP
jgi:glycosyltransferase involved in cell wall biosynthesis